MVNVTGSLLSLLSEELAPEARARTYFHGTCSEDKALGIMKNGLDPAQTEVKYGSKKPFLRPVAGHVYITPNPGYALVYALGGDVAGTNFFTNDYGKNFIAKDGQFGFMFTVNGDDMTDAVPDEDDIGQVISGLLSGHRIGKYNWDLIDTIAYGLKSAAQSNLTPAALRRIKDGDMAWCAKAGKQLLKKLSPTILQTLIKANTSLAHVGHLKVSGCWKIDKLRCQELAKDGSNFQEIGEKIA